MGTLFEHPKQKQTHNHTNLSITKTSCWAPFFAKKKKNPFLEDIHLSLLSRYMCMEFNLQIGLEKEEKKKEMN